MSTPLTRSNPKLYPETQDVDAGKLAPALNALCDWNRIDGGLRMRMSKCRISEYCQYWKEDTMLKHNSYFNGRVQSLALVVDGVNATVGVMEPGRYTFSTSSEEHMTITAGVLNAQLPGDPVWREYAAGETFVVAPGKSFEVEAGRDVAYICLYK
jgi:uncharacterized protein YaiE (UPF0345 family)